jgi:hypothetical protein
VEEEKPISGVVDHPMKTNPAFFQTRVIGGNEFSLDVGTPHGTLHWKSSRYMRSDIADKTPIGNRGEG